MPTRCDLRAKYGNAAMREVVNRAIRAELPGGGQVLDALAALTQEADRPRAGRHPAQLAAIRAAVGQVGAVRDLLAEAILKTYGDE